jgi:hypothetical protein
LANTLKLPPRAFAKRGGSTWTQAEAAAAKFELMLNLNYNIFSEGNIMDDDPGSVPEHLPALI